MMTFFLFLEPYLAEWFRHRCHFTDPIELPRGCPESDLLCELLEVQEGHQNETPKVFPEEGEVTIKVPCFKYKDIRKYNYLSQDALRRLHQCIKNSFQVELWHDLHTVKNVVRRTDLTISEWMVAHGMEDNARNWNTVAKILQRKRASYFTNHRLTNHKSKSRK